MIIRNDSPETVPSFAVMRVTGAGTDMGGQFFLKVDQPSDSFETYYLVNGQFPILAGKYGSACDRQDTGLRAQPVERDLLGTAIAASRRSMRAADLTHVIRLALKGETTGARHYLESAHARQCRRPRYPPLYGQ